MTEKWKPIDIVDGKLVKIDRNLAMKRLTQQDRIEQERIKGQQNKVFRLKGRIG